MTEIKFRKRKSDEIRLADDGPGLAYLLFCYKPFAVQAHYLCAHAHESLWLAERSKQHQNYTVFHGLKFVDFSDIRNKYI